MATLTLLLTVMVLILMLMISTIKRLYFLILVSSIYLGLGPPPLINKSWFFLFEGIHPPRLFHPLARVILIV
jgi:hypothetical protein